MAAPIIVASLVGGLIQACGTLVGKVLVSLGFGLAVYTGLQTGLSWLQSQIVSNANALPIQVIAVMGALKVGSIVNILLSALSARMLLNGVSSGTLKRWVVK